VPALEQAAYEHDEPLVRGHAVWALAHLAGAGAKPVIERVLRRDDDDFVRGECVGVLDSM
jgi:HEAT repeat protein